MAEADEKYTKVVEKLIEIGEQLVKEWTEGKFEWKHPMFEYEGPYPPAPTDKVDAFDRTTLEDRFIQLLNDKKLKVGDQRSLHVQADLIAALEKAFRARHRGRITHFAYGVSRPWGHTQAEGFLRLALQRLPIMEGG